MARLCERPGCSVPADVSYGFDAEHLVVWLGAFQAAQGVKCGVLCRRHADAMVVPLGWMLDDRREPVPRLFRPPTEAPTGPMVRPRPKRPRLDAGAGTVQLRLDDYPAPAELATALVEAVHEAVAVGAPEVAIPAEAPDAAEIDAAEIDAAEIDAAEIDAAEIDAAEVLPWQPVFDETDDLQGLLKARGRLLSRAFHGIAADGG